MTTHDQLAGWLDELASAAPAPGGGAAAAVSASMAASLVCMVCNLTRGKPKYAAYEAQMTRVLEAAEVARRTTLALADDDARAFEGVIAAYRLPRASEAETSARTTAIQAALVAAAQVPLRTAELAVAIIGLAGELVEGCNPTVISDVAVAAATARAAVQASVLTAQINLASITDAEQRRVIAEALERHRGALAQADAVSAAVCARMAPPT